MKKAFMIVGAILALGAVIALAVNLLSAGTRQAAKDFLIHATSDRPSEAHALLHPQLGATISVDDLGAMFAAAKPYETIRFTQIASSSGEPTEISGTAKTADGCSSAVSFQFWDNLIVSFDVTPLCR